MVNVLYLGFLTSLGFYRNMGNYMELFAKNISEAEEQKMSKHRCMEVLCKFSDELDKCSEIYSEIYKITRRFYKLFQFCAFFTICLMTMSLIRNVHHALIYYLKYEQIIWSSLIFSVLRFLDFIIFPLVVDLMVEESRVPQNLQWDCMFPGVDKRWDKSVNQFLTQLRFEEIKLNVYGLFELNNNLCLLILSTAITYLTVLIQLSMIGSI
ncbi:gustatory receptor for bitter taste 93a-like [Episyrphus balteatus]|uniref:gustatory receptor for bitter taste 93a-like n=1 Tax=Episyrphus balteatus TaxID=286459 RepID=UPI00248647F9|nr:gustatory receptor for bitter taste 93a-like [Episyrphus balteatus]